MNDEIIEIMELGPRQIRFVFPSIFMLIWIIFGVIDNLDNRTLINNLDNKTLINKILQLELGKFFILMIVILIGFGFLIGTITTFILRIIAKFCRLPYYEAYISNDAIERISKKIGIEYKDEYMLYAVATFDHYFLPKDVHDWLMRRWISFTIQANSIVAIVMALLIGFGILRFYLNIIWIIISLFMISILAFGAYQTWNESKQMIEFQSRIEYTKKMF